jgi:hypothetical protein
VNKPLPLPIRDKCPAHLILLDFNLLKLQRDYTSARYGTVGSWFCVADWLAFVHFIEGGLFDWKLSLSNANLNTRTSHESSIKLMIRPPVIRKLYFNIVMC